MAKAHPLIRYEWALRAPLEPDASAEKIAYWIEWAAVDPWTFDDLLRMVGQAVADGRDLHPALAKWLHEGVCHHVETKQPMRPRQHGLPRNPKSDMAIAVLVDVMMANGRDKTEAFQRLGKSLHKSPKTIESAWRRAWSL